MSDDRLIVALDVPDVLAGQRLVDELGDAVSFYKIGLGMLTGGGLALANELSARGKRVFLDLKLFDIGATIEAAVRGVSRFDLDFLTVHGDPHVVKAALRGRGERDLKILAISVLTSLDRSDLDDMMIADGNLGQITIERARRALSAGADGVIASALEAEAIRALPEARGRLIVTPGIRPAGSDLDDQKRTSTPGKAILAGANHIVVGRPIHGATDPRAAALSIIQEITAAHR